MVRVITVSPKNVYYAKLSIKTRLNIIYIA